MSQIANRYANALFELALEYNQVDAWQEQLQVISNAFAQDKSYLSFFGSYQITSESKKNVLSKVFEGKLDKSIMNFLLLLVDKKRIKYILPIASSFHSLCNASKNVKEGIVYSVYELQDEEKKQIEASISERMECRVSLANRIDRSLISGIKVIVENQIMDGSMRNRINSLKTELLKESR